MPFGDMHEYTLLYTYKCTLRQMHTYIDWHKIINEHNTEIFFSKYHLSINQNYLKTTKKDTVDTKYSICIVF